VTELHWQKRVTGGSAILAVVGKIQKYKIWGWKSPFWGKFVGEVEIFEHP